MGKRRKLQKQAQHQKHQHKLLHPEQQLNEETSTKQCTPSQLPGDKVSAGRYSQDIDNTRLFPSWTPWLATFVTLVFRVYHVIDPENWWVLHPDEIFQSMEVAHSELYGYGLRPYEYTPAAKGNNISLYQQRELTTGMYALRSPILPQYMVLCTWLANLIGLDISNPYLLFRLSHVLMTSFLPLAAAHFAKAICRCSDVASVTAIVTASSAYLHVIGSHTVINSFVSTPLFLSLASVISLLRAGEDRHGKPSRHKEENNNDDPNLHDFHDQNYSSDSHHPKSDDPLLTQGIPGIPSEVLPRYTDSELYTALPTVSTKEMLSDNCVSQQTCNFRETECIQRGFTNPTQSACTDTVFKTKFPMCSSEKQSDSDYGTLSSRSSSSSSDSILNISDDETANNDNITDHTNCMQHENSVNNTTLSRKAPSSCQIRQFIIDIVSGLFLAIVLYIRPDTVLVVGALVVGNYRFSLTRFIISNNRFWCLVLGGLIGLLLAISNDAMFYGSLVLTPLNWVKLNVFSGMSAQLFGESGKFFYIHRLFLDDAGMCLASMLFLFPVFAKVFQIIVPKYSITHSTLKSKLEVESDQQSQKKENSASTCASAVESKIALLINSSVQVSLENFTIHVLCVAGVTTIYSCMRHKEDRFLHDTVVIFFIAVSQSLIVIIQSVVTYAEHCHGFGLGSTVTKHNKETRPRNYKVNKDHKCLNKTPRQLLLCAVLVTFLATQIKTFRVSKGGQSKAYRSSSMASSLDTSHCLYFLSKQQNVTGIFIERNIADTGANSLLHKRVPILYQMGNDFIEFTHASLTLTGRKCVIGADSNSSVNARESDSCEVGFYTLNKVSDLLHIENSVGFLKKIARPPPVRNSAQHRHNGHDVKHPRYNYAVVQAEKEFLSPAFRPVFWTASMWVWRRMDMPQTEARLLASAGYEALSSNSKARSQDDQSLRKNESRSTTGGRKNKTLSDLEMPKDRAADKASSRPKDHTAKDDVNNRSKSKKNVVKPEANSKFLEYEGEILKQLGNYWVALQRFNSLILKATSQGHDNKQVKANILASTIFCLHRLGERLKAQKLYNECVALHPQELCQNGAQAFL